jgi:hypothetical protein
MSQSSQVVCTEPGLQGLPSPVRNNFFYGMLLNEAVLRKDQRYFDGKRWLLNRIGIGKGVLAGLDFDVFPAAIDGKNPEKSNWQIEIDAGVALDGFGREIVVPAKYTPPILQEARCPGSNAEVSLIDEQGEVKASNLLEFIRRLGVSKPREQSTKQNADHEQHEQSNQTNRTTHVLELQIAYKPVPTDPAPVKAGNCSHECEPSSIREEFRLRVVRLENDPRQKVATSSPASLAYSSAIDGELNHTDPLWQQNPGKIFPIEPVENIRHRGTAQTSPEMVAGAVPAPDQCHEWVTIGLIELIVTWQYDTSNQSLYHVPKSIEFKRIDRYYRQLFSNDALSRLVFELANRVDEAARVRVLTYDGIDGASGECQTANVYQKIAKPLKVKVVDSQMGQPQDHESLLVRFEVQSTDGGSLSLAGEPTDHSRKYVDVKVLENGSIENGVIWHLGRTPGQHTVSARIISKHPSAHPFVPPFHGGSQLTFHAKALSTAPTLVGIEFKEPWWFNSDCHKYVWNDRGELKLKLFFSRKLLKDQVEKFDDFFRVLAVVRDRQRKHHVTLTRLHFADAYNYDPVCCKSPTSSEAVEEVWNIDYRLEGLPQLCPGDTLRIVLLGRVEPSGMLQSVSSINYPTRQTLDLSFEGSYLSKSYRDWLWDNGSYLDPDSDDDQVVAKYQSAKAPLEREPRENQVISSEEKDATRRFWDRFRPRERSLPTGDGTEAGEFHKTFEFKLPCSC